MSAASDDLWSTTRCDPTGDLFGDLPAQTTLSKRGEQLEVIAAASPLYKQRKLEPESMDVIMKALGTDAVARRILAKCESLATGQCIGVRLNLNVLRNTAVAVHTIHRATSADGHTKGRGFYRGEEIAAGTAAKGPMASADGAYQPTDESLSFDGVLLRFNPKREHLFTDEDGFAVQYAEHVTIMGHRAYARGMLRYFSEASAPEKAGDAPSNARFKS